MNYCIKCGAKINEKMKFCSECGEPIQKQAFDRREEYAGSVIRCPNCEATVDAFSMACPFCGYEFRNTKASKASYDFMEKLKAARSLEQRVTLIKNFPIPNNKEDLFEFVNLAASNIDISLLDEDIPDNNPDKVLTKAWQAKLYQVYTKAILLFEKTDPHLEKIQKVYEASQIKIHKQALKQTRKYRTGLVITLSGVFIALLIIIIGLVAGALGNHSMDSSRANLLIFIGGIILIVNAVISGRGDGGVVAPIGSALGSVLAVAISTIYPMLDKSWSMVSSRSNAIMLFAVIALIISVVNILKSAKRKYGNKY